MTITGTPIRFIRPNWPENEHWWQNSANWHRWVIDVKLQYKTKTDVNDLIENKMKIIKIKNKTRMNMEMWNMMIMRTSTTHMTATTLMKMERKTTMNKIEMIIIRRWKGKNRIVWWLNSTFTYQYHSDISPLEILPSILKICINDVHLFINGEKGIYWPVVILWQYILYGIIFLYSSKFLWWLCSMGS